MGGRITETAGGEEGWNKTRLQVTVTVVVLVVVVCPCSRLVDKVKRCKERTINTTLAASTVGNLQPAGRGFHSSKCHLSHAPVHYDLSSTASRRGISYSLAAGTLRHN